MCKIPIQYHSTVRMLVDPQTRPIQKGRTSKKLEMKSSTCPQNADNCPGTTYFKEEVTPADTIRFTNFVQRDKPWTYTYTVLQLWDTLWTNSVRSNLPRGLATTRKSSYTSSSPCHQVKLTGKKIYASLHQAAASRSFSQNLLYG